MSRAAGEAERRRRARARKEAAAAATQPAATVRPGWAEKETDAVLVDCPDPANHRVCPTSGDKHDWYKPHPRPADHKYQCLACGHYDLDDYK